jgi:hypothetical protein
VIRVNGLLDTNAHAIQKDGKNKIIKIKGNFNR